MASFNVLDAAAQAAQSETVDLDKDVIKVFSLPKGKSGMYIFLPLTTAFAKELLRGYDVKIPGLFNISSDELTDEILEILQKKEHILLFGIDVYTGESIVATQRIDAPNDAPAGSPKALIWALVDAIGKSEEMPVVVIHRIKDNDPFSSLYQCQIDTKAEEKEPEIIGAIRNRLIEISDHSDDDLFAKAFPAQSIVSLKAQYPLFAKKLEMISRFGGGVQ